MKMVRGGGMLTQGSSFLATAGLICKTPVGVLRNCASQKKSAGLPNVGLACVKPPVGFLQRSDTKLRMALTYATRSASSAILDFDNTNSTIAGGRGKVAMTLVTQDQAYGNQKSWSTILESRPR